MLGGPRSLLGPTFVSVFSRLPSLHGAQSCIIQIADDSGSLTDDEWDQTYKANVMAHLWLMQSLEDELKKNKGCFIVSASVAGLRPTGSSMAYCESALRCVEGCS